MKKHHLPALLLALIITIQPLCVQASDVSMLEDSTVTASFDLTDSVTELSDTTPSAAGLDADSALAAVDALDLDGEALLLLERNSGTMVYAKNIDEQREPASITKIMTCLLALEHGDLSAEVTVTESALETMDPDGSSADLLAGETYTLEELLYCLMVKSANDAALVIAEYIGGSQEGFVQMMNDRAAELGCTGTHFANPHGMHDDNHYSTARDLAKIMSAALEYETFQDLYSTDYYEIPATDLQDSRPAYSTNYLISTDTTAEYYDDRVVGGKTGFTTPAGRCVICVAEDETRSYLAVVLGASATDDEGNTVYSSFSTASALFDFGFDQFTLETILPEWSSVVTVPVSGGAKDATLIVPSEVEAVVPLDYSQQQLTAGYTLSTTLTAPLAQDVEVGTLMICYNGICISQSPLVTAAEVVVMDSAKQQALSESSTTEAVSSETPEQSSGSNGFLKILGTVFLVLLGIIALAILILLVLIIRANVIRRRRRRHRRSRRR